MSKKKIRVRLGNLVENMIGNTIVRAKLEAPVLEGEPEELVWYRIPMPDCISGDGSEYHIYLKKGTTDNLCIFFSGGGVAWDEYTAAHPVTGGAVAAGRPNYYWSNLRPFTQLMNINIGITENDPLKNPFTDWNFVIITYSTGDFHVGDNDFEYTAPDGNRKVLHFHGKKNVMSSLNIAKQFFPEPKKLLIAGDSAGAFAVPAHAQTIVGDYYSECQDITVFSDSGLFPYRHWKRVARDVWRCDERYWQAIHSANITLDWYEALYERFGSRLKYLFASSTHDYLLSTYYNYILNGEYKTNKEVQEIYNISLIKMYEFLTKLEPHFGFYINDRRNITTHGGTVHTAVRESYFSAKKGSLPSMAEWLFDAVNGIVYSVGTEMLEY